jgi:hypothetical protein
VTTSKKRHARNLLVLMACLSFVAVAAAAQTARHRTQLFQNEGQMFGASAPNGQAQEASTAKLWKFSITGFGYLVPDDESYPAATLTADRNWLHLEARYNYEAQQTGSLWAGYNFSVGSKVLLELTPMIAGVFGNTAGVAPGGEIALSYRWFSVSSEIEYVFDTRGETDSFLYSWNEFTYTPVDWLYVGLAAQRTRAYETELDVQRGFLAGVSRGSADFTTYVFNAGWTDPTVVLALRFSF